MTIIDNAQPGLPRPVQLGTAYYLDADGIPRTAPIYEAGPATNGQRIQAEDIDPTWTFVREELFPDSEPPTLTADERLDAARAALVTIDSLAAPVLPVDLLDVLTDLRTALEP